MALLVLAAALLPLHRRPHDSGLPLASIIVGGNASTAAWCSGACAGGVELRPSSQRSLNDVPENYFLIGCD
jgi:hypothetical protein